MISSSKVYERVADRVLDLIEKGVYPAGRRLPSVRTLGRSMRVSINTVLAAYAWLERRGRLEARPRSGYFVRVHPVGSLPSPASLKVNPVPVTVHKLVQEIVRVTSNPKLIPLGSATVDPRLLPLARLNRILSSVARRDPVAAHSYADPAGLKTLRIQIARWTAESGADFRPDELVITSGAQEALHLALEAVCRPNDPVAVEVPVYYGILQAIESLRLRAIEIPADASEGINLNALRIVLKQRRPRAVVVIPTCNNPLGSSMPEDKKRKLVRMLAQEQVPLIEDDTSGNLHFDSVRPPPAKAFDTQGLVLYCSSISKVLSPGWRLGWMACGRFRSEVEHLKTFRTSANPTAPQMALAEYLEEGTFGRHLSSLRKIHAGQVDLMSRAIGRSFPVGTQISSPSGGFQLWVELPPRVNALQLYRLALQSGITTVPGPVFSARGRFRNYVRLSAGRWTEQEGDAISSLGRLVRLMRSGSSVKLPANPRSGSRRPQ
ncbi:MAG: PLP-dependent aminotransferase family protein [Planctomycetes bacterium]|nr:PLP-dependent aminotransferase family protein [Planctomycetota bacterium]